VSNDRSLDPHFFRHESGRLVAALVRAFGPAHLALAEDVAQDALLSALELWKLNGVPERPSAWLLTCAKNKAIDALRRVRTSKTYAPELSRFLESEWTLVPTIEAALDARAMQDDELRMMFSVCQPRLPVEAQVALVLHLVSGLGIDEIAAAFFASHSAIEKRIQRGKAAIAEMPALFALDDADVEERLGAVQSAIYLLFNEGYHGASPESAVREDLCREALRLVTLLCKHARTDTPSTRALSALLHLHASRLHARTDAEGRLLTLFEQDRASWDRNLIETGLSYLAKSAEGDAICEYHLEAAIAAHQVTATSREDTPWDAIVTLYDRLFEARPSPVVALSRAIAIAERSGPHAGLEAIESIAHKERLAHYPFYEGTLGELLRRTGDIDGARRHFAAAAALARSPMERRFFEERVGR
jgi:RNA polymerase sigma-70 factor (ECF subfamily)